MTLAENRSSPLRKLLLTKFQHSSENLRRYAKGKGKDYCLSVIREIEDDRLLIGYFSDVGFFNGSNLHQVRCGNFKTWAFMPMGYEDVTEWFMDEYEKKGMCFSGDSNHVFKTNGSIRSCIYCGETQVKKEEVVKRVYWESVGKQT